MSVNGVEFETMEITSRFNVFRQSTNVLKRLEADFEHVALGGGLQVQPCPRHVGPVEPEALSDFGLFEPVLQAIQIGMGCVNVNDRLPRNLARMGEALVVNHPRRHARVVMVRMNVEKPPSIIAMPFLKGFKSRRNPVQFGHQADQHAQHGGLPCVQCRKESSAVLRSRTSLSKASNACRSVGFKRATVRRQVLQFVLNAYSP